MSVLTLGEVRQSIDTVVEGKRRLMLVDWLANDLPAFFAGRILNIDGAVADRWGRLISATGRPSPTIDRLLAATALEHDLVLVTRNTKDFAGLPVELVNPWSA